MPDGTAPGGQAAPAGGRPAPISSRRLSDQLAERLADQVRHGALVAGDRLPTEQQLAAAHGVSRTVVREAVHQLKSQGLLVSRQGSGVYVADAAMRQPLPFDASVLGSLDAVLQVLAVRRAIEGEVAALAAERAGPAQAAGLAQALAAIDAAAARGADGVAEDLAFHRAIAEATGNPQFPRLLSHLEQYLREAMRVTRGNEARHRAFAQAVRREHQAIVAAIAAGDAAGARRAAVRHMQQAEKRLVQAGVVPDTRPAAAPRAARPSRQAT